MLSIKVLQRQAMCRGASRCAPVRPSVGVVSFAPYRPTTRPAFRGALMRRDAELKRSATTSVDLHRREVLVNLCEEFVHEWVAAMRHGLTRAVKNDLHILVDDDVVIRCSDGFNTMEVKGVQALEDKIMHAVNNPGFRATDVVLSAANDDEDTVFCLLAGHYVDEHGKQGEAAWQINKFDVLLDDVSRHITAITERSQLSSADIARLGLPAQHIDFPIDRIATYPQACNKMEPFATLAVAFKVVMSTPGGAGPGTAECFNVRRARENAKQLCTVLCSGSREDLLDGMVDPVSFQLYDVHAALLPHGKAVKSFMDVKTSLKILKEKYDMKCELLDNAVSMTCNGGFSHWRSHITDRNSGNKFCVEGMQVDIYNEDGLWQSIWLFRDPMDVERDILSKAEYNWLHGDQPMP